MVNLGKGVGAGDHTVIFLSTLSICHYDLAISRRTLSSMMISNGMPGFEKCVFKILKSF
jgi:hypothetical protein